jgi:hypothetical protein
VTTPGHAGVGPQVVGPPTSKLTKFVWLGSMMLIVPLNLWLGMHGRVVVVVLLPGALVVVGVIVVVVGTVVDVVVVGMVVVVSQTPWSQISSLVQA